MRTIRQGLMFLIFAALGIATTKHVPSINQGDTVSNVDAWEYVLAALIPFIIQFINRPSFSPAKKRFVMVGVTIVIAVVTTWLQGNLLPLNLETLGTRIVTLVGAVQVAYTLLTQASPTRTLLNWLEVATTPRTSPAVAVQQKQAVSQEQMIVYAGDVKIDPPLAA